jgi:hypothetical protein
VLVRDNALELRLVQRWLDSWSGIGLVVVGMTHQGWDVQLTACAARDWRANFFPVGIAHPIVDRPDRRGGELEAGVNGRPSGSRTTAGPAGPGE